MPVLISDTSVLIDLQRAQLLPALFLLPFEFAVPDLLYERELAGDLGDQLTELGLRIEILTGQELIQATDARRRDSRLSVVDSAAYAVAKSREWCLLSGDRALRELADAEQVETHGVLWLFDQFANGGYVDLARLHAGLSAVSEHPRCRLPIAEIQIRLQRFSAP